jgi:hypothetical protein
MLKNIKWDILLIWTGALLFCFLCWIGLVRAVSR